MRVERLPSPPNPIIRPHMDARMGANVNGPSLIRVPEWVQSPLGRYYLYFGHHQGKYIRLAYAEALEGPWHTYEPGVLDLENSFFVGHIASPDVLVDDDRRELRLYFHGPLAPHDRNVGPHGRHAQATRAALSVDGLHFTAREEVLGSSYMRVFRYRGAHHGVSMSGIFLRSDDGLTSFVEGPTLYGEEQRHVGLKRVGDLLYVFHSNRGDCAERIRVSTVDLRPDWNAWRASPPQDVLRPEHDWEGVNEPLVPSEGGAIHHPVHQLRDPYVFAEDGRDYLLYTVAGESGIAIARLFLD
ncbi:MAG TPA: hypothetical protein VFX49_06930 [Chloroflexota bacterium]|nr:hypothetical protein [Chloroflexota bacterium]